MICLKEKMGHIVRCFFWRPEPVEQSDIDDFFLYSALVPQADWWMLGARFAALVVAYDVAVLAVAYFAFFA